MGRVVRTEDLDHWTIREFEPPVPDPLPDATWQVAHTMKARSGSPPEPGIVRFLQQVEDPASGMQTVIERTLRRESF